MNQDKLIAEYHFIRGEISATWDLAVWRNGVPYVGVMEVPYNEHIDKYLKRKEEICRLLGKSDCELEFCTGCPDCGSSIVQIPEGDLE